LGSASRGSLTRWLKADAAPPFSRGAVSTVTATFGAVSLPEFWTRIFIDACWAIDCSAGNDASTTSTRNSPSGSSASWRSPPPQPASAIAPASSMAVGRVLRARAIMARANIPPASAGRRRSAVGSAACRWCIWRPIPTTS
jgi:hypothetical protein